MKDRDKTMKTNFIKENSAMKSMKKAMMGGVTALIILGIIAMATACSSAPKDTAADNSSNELSASDQAGSAPEGTAPADDIADGADDKPAGSNPGTEPDSTISAILNGVSEITKEVGETTMEKSTDQIDNKTEEIKDITGQLDKKAEDTADNAAQPDNKTEEKKGDPDHPVVEITVKDFGKITVELDRGVAPLSVDNFVNLVKNHYYDGLTFHRIIKGFMIQGGAPSPSSPALTSIKGEFAENGVDNPMRHVRGTISMARTLDPNSASGQFFICDADSPHLDGKYAAFGKVTSGLDVVDSIADTPVVDFNGTVAEGNQPVIESVTMVN